MLSSIPVALVLLALAALAAGSLATVVALLVLSRRHRVHLTADEVHRVRTADGWTIGLARWRPAPGTEGSTRVPVIVCHGLGANAVSLDLDEHISLPRTLRARGFDVWAVDLRGRDGASAPAGTSGWDFSFDHHARYDVPAAIDHVKLVTGAERVAWVGHSMGGIVIYAHAEATAGRDLACVATIASPVRAVRRPRIGQAHHLLKLLPIPAIHAGLFSRVGAPLAGYYHPPPVWTLLNPGNVEPRIMRVGMASALTDLPVRLLRQLDRWLATGRLVSEDGSRVYFERLGAVLTPWLAIGAVGDNLVPWENARAGFDLLGSPEKRWLLVGKEHGHAADYGHCDLVIGPRAREDVFGPIAEFLEKHGARAPGGTSSPRAQAAPAVASQYPVQRDAVTSGTTTAEAQSAPR